VFVLVRSPTGELLQKENWREFNELGLRLKPTRDGRTPRN